MDIATAYLYGLLNNDIYMKISKGFKMTKAYIQNPINFVQLNSKNLYMH